MKNTIAVSLLALALAGCQSVEKEDYNKQTVTADMPAECNYYGNPALVAPEWICNPSSDDDVFIREAVGFSGNSAGGIAHQKNLAILQAKKELADQVKSEIITKVKSKTGTLGVAGSAGASSANSSEMEAIANVQLQGVKIIRSLRGPDGFFYVRVGLPMDVLKQNVEAVVTGIEKNSPATLPLSTPAQNKQLSDDIAKALGEV